MERFLVAKSLIRIKGDYEEPVFDADPNGPTYTTSATYTIDKYQSFWLDDKAVDDTGLFNIKFRTMEYGASLFGGIFYGCISLDELAESCVELKGEEIDTYQSLATNCYRLEKEIIDSKYEVSMADAFFYENVDNLQTEEDYDLLWNALKLISHNACEEVKMQFAYENRLERMKLFLSRRNSFISKDITAYM